MKSNESLQDAVLLAKQVIAGDMDASLGCGLISAIGAKLNYPAELSVFVMLDHEQYRHEQFGISQDSCLPDILDACRTLIAAYG